MDFHIHDVSNGVPAICDSIRRPIVYAASPRGSAVKMCEKNVIRNPRYNFPLNSPHQSIIRFTVLNIAYAFPSADVTAQFFAPMCESHISRYSGQLSSSSSCFPSARISPFFRTTMLSAFFIVESL